MVPPNNKDDLDICKFMITSLKIKNLKNMKNSQFTVKGENILQSIGYLDKLEGNIIIDIICLNDINSIVINNGIKATTNFISKINNGIIFIFIIKYNIIYIYIYIF